MPDGSRAQYDREMTCTFCGGPIPSDGLFCPRCGSAVGGRGEATLAQLARPVAERRVTSILFGDLVGFTPFSEARDAEEVRDLLSEYYQRCRRIVARYGGLIEKFIGDAVVAIWGVPVAHEDDAERAVRAGSELVSAVSEYGASVGVPELALRVGIVTGEVAVTLGVEVEGMVAGDAVNTASRVQAQARPRSVWVDSQTRQLTEAVAEFASVGDHALKGKREPMALFEVLSVADTATGAPRSSVEAPLVGRERAFGVVRETFHAVVGEGRGALLIVSGEAGLGKTRLAWSLHDYVDGLKDSVRWHWGRALAYGDGVAFAPLTAAVAARIGVTADDDAATVSARLAGALHDHVPDAGQREWLEPRLAVLLNNAADQRFSGGELFAAWLAWFEALGAGGTPVVWVIDDAQRADDGVLDFAEHAAASARVPLLVVLLTRPELLRRRPHLTTSPRATVVNLEGLPVPTMAALVKQLVGNLPPAMVDRVVDRAEGVPLYAVEIIRSLRDKGMVSPGASGLQFTDTAVEPAAIAAPTSLRVLISSRLDALPPDDRVVLGSAAVLGTTFTVEPLAALTGSAVPALTTQLPALVHRDLLRVVRDRRSAEIGQHAFVQTLVREVAYQTQSRRDRAERHVAAARYLEGRGEQGGHIAAVIAGHLTDASELVFATDPRRADLRAQAASWHERAGDRAHALGAPGDALASYETALDLAADPASRVRLRLAAADAAIVAAQYERAIAHTLVVGRDEPASLVARADAARGQAQRRLGQSADAVAVLSPWLARLDELPAAEASELARELAFSLHLVGDLAAAVPTGERALDLARRSGRPDLIARAWNVVAVHKDIGGDWRGARTLYAQAADYAREHRLTTELGFILQNLSAIDLSRDLAVGIRTAREALDLAQQTGHTSQANYAATNLIEGLRTVGRWDEAIAVSAERVIGDSIASGLLDVHQIALDLGLIALARGEAPPVITFRHDRDPMTLALDAAAHGDYATAFEVAHRDLLVKFEHSGHDEEFTVTWTACADWAIEAGRHDEVPAVLALAQEAQPDTVTPVLAAQLLRLRGTAAAAGHAEAAEEDLRGAIGALDALGALPYAARAQAVLSALFRATGRPAEAETLHAAARSTFAALGARHWLAALQ